MKRVEIPDPAKLRLSETIRTTSEGETSLGVANYDSVNGVILGDSVHGTYLRDALGSVTATIPNKVIANTYRYKPYGGLLANPGRSQSYR
jgi:hypothetical protein